MATMHKNLEIKGQLFYCADMVRFNQFTEEKKKYVAHIGQLDDQTVETLTNMGIHVGTHDVKGRFIDCKSKFVQRAFEKNGGELDPLTIGNGTKCTAEVAPYQWKFGNKSGFNASLKKLTVTELIKYDPSTNNAEEEADDIL